MAPKSFWNQYKQAIVTAIIALVLSGGAISFGVQVLSCPREIREMKAGKADKSEIQVLNEKINGIDGKVTVIIELLQQEKRKKK